MRSVSLRAVKVRGLGRSWQVAVSTVPAHWISAMRTLLVSSLVKVTVES
jgi:hypothetical protein